MQKLKRAGSRFLICVENKGYAVSLEKRNGAQKGVASCNRIFAGARRTVVLPAFDLIVLVKRR